MITTPCGIVWRTAIAYFAVVACAHAAVKPIFHTTAPVPDSNDVYNFVGASRDGLNVGDANGLDGPLNDEFTYVRQNNDGRNVAQGQAFLMPRAPFLVINSIWVKAAGYSNNGSMQESGYDGTQYNFSPHNDDDPAFSFYLAANQSSVSPLVSETYDLTGVTANNPASSGTVKSDNGSGVWIELPFRYTVFPPSFPSTEGALVDFEIGVPFSEAAQFEWLGSRDNVLPGGWAFTRYSNISSTIHTGDRVFFVDVEGGVPLPEPGTLKVALLGCLAILGRRSVAHAPSRRHIPLSSRCFLPASCE